MPITVYGSGSNPNALINWGEIYYSKLSWSDLVPKQFSFYFPKTPVSIKRVKTMTSGDVFPNDWSLFVSNDNKTFINIIKSHTMCNPEDTIIAGTRTLCKDGTIKYHDASLVENYYYFVKFTMQANTFYTDDGWKDYISIRGIEFFGNFLYVYKHCTPKKFTFSLAFLIAYVYHF